MPEALLRLPEVLQRCGIGRSQAYSLIARDEFPRPIKVEQGLQNVKSLDARLKARVRLANRATEVDREVNTLISQYARNGTPIEFVEPKPIKGSADEAHADINAKLAAVRKAPAPKEDVEKTLIGKIDELASQAVVHVSFGDEPPILFPPVTITAEPHSYFPGVVPAAPDPRPWIARHFRDDLVKNIKAEIAAHYARKPSGMSRAEKAKRIKELEAERLNIDHIRCKAVWDDFNAGRTTSLDLPADCDPRAVLGLKGPALRKHDN